MEDWFIGVNSTGQRRAFNLMPNSITFNRATYDETLKKVNLAPEVILGDLSALNNDKLKLKSGLYAKNAYLEGSFYANQDGENKVSLDDKGINLGNALVYDTETEYLVITGYTEQETTITIVYAVKQMDLVEQELTIDEKIVQLKNVDTEHELALAELTDMILGGVQ